MNKKIEITKERLEQLEGFESVVQALKDNGFDTFKDVKEFLQAHKKSNIYTQLKSLGGYINDIPLVIDPCKMCEHSRNRGKRKSDFLPDYDRRICERCCWFYDSMFKI